MNLSKQNFIDVLKRIIFVFFCIFLSHTGFSQGAPSSLFPDLQYFKITYPLNNSGNDYTGVSYANRNNPHIASYEVNNLVGYTPPSPFSGYFNLTGSELIFKAHCAGALTSINAYPRSELREKVNGGNNLWLFADEHEMNTTFRVTNLPDQKQEVCMLQIKGNSCNCTNNTEEALRLEYRQDGNSGFHAVINENTTLNDIMDYTLGDEVDARLYVNNGQVTVELNNLNVSGPNGEWTYTYTSNYSHGYFKAGCYTQSSIWVEKNGVANELPTAYGEVAFSKLILGPNPNVCVPEVPANITATTLSSSSVWLDWDDVNLASHYNLRYRIVGNPIWDYIYTVPLSEHTLAGLQYGQTYEWEVRAKCPDNSALPYEDGPGPNFTMPAAPTDSQIHIESGDLYIEDSDFGTVYKSPNGTCFRLNIDDNGTLKVVAVACP